MPQSGDRVGDAVDHLLDGSLPLGRAEVAAEVLAGHDVGGQGAPALRELEVLLLEHGLAVLVGDGRLAEVPLDGVVRVDVRARVSPLDGQALPGRLLALGQLDVALRPSSRARFRFRSWSWPFAVPLAGLVGAEDRAMVGCVPLRASAVGRRPRNPVPWGRPPTVRRLAVRRILRPITVIRPPSSVKAKTTTSGGTFDPRTTR